MKSLYSVCALSLAYPYFCCKSPKSFSFFPSTAVRSSSVSLPQFSLTLPLISFHFPFRTSSFMFALLSSCSKKKGGPAKIHPPFSFGPPVYQNQGHRAPPPQGLLSSLADPCHSNTVHQPSESASVRNASRCLSDFRIGVCPMAGRGTRGGRV